MLGNVADFGKTLAQTVVDSNLSQRAQGLFAAPTVSDAQQARDLQAMDVFAGGAAPAPQQQPPAAPAMPQQQPQAQQQQQPEPPKSEMEALKRATPNVAERGHGSLERLKGFLRVHENDVLLAGDMSKARHASAEGGLDTVGYGHKLTAEEDRTGKIYGYEIKKLTPKQIDHILDLDIKVHTKKAKRVVESKGADWSKMSPRERAMMTEMSFNGVLPQFTKFIAAINAGDYKTAREEYTRTYTDKKGVVKPLTKRNDAFYTTFLSDDAIKANP